MFNEGIIGPQNSTSDSFPTKARMGRQGEQMASELHPRYYEETYRGIGFNLQTQGTATTTTAALATTWTGLGFANPAGSGVNAVLMKMSACQFAVGAAATIGVMGGVGTITSTLTPQSRLIGSGAVSKMNGSAGATISTPVLISTFASVGSVATSSIPLVPGAFYDFEGSIIVPPGSFICTYTSIVTTTSLQFGFFWVEVPI
jgi:hypothetical protein